MRRHTTVSLRTHGLHIQRPRDLLSHILLRSAATAAS